MILVPQIFKTNLDPLPIQHLVGEDRKGGWVENYGRGSRDFHLRAPLCMAWHLRSGLFCSVKNPKSSWHCLFRLKMKTLLPLATERARLKETNTVIRDSQV